MQQIGAFNAKSRLSELLREVAAGNSYIITNRGKQVAALIPVAELAQQPETEEIEQLLTLLHERNDSARRALINAEQELAKTRAYFAQQREARSRV